MSDQMKRAAMRKWLQAYFGTVLKIPADQIDPGRSLFEFGISSRQAVRLAGKIEQQLNMEIEATIAYEFPTIEELAGELIRRQAASEGADT
ncbi:MAG: acyl carrier protein [bacterium]|nr:acyl carrier protein [bacterium]